MTGKVPKQSAQSQGCTPAAKWWQSGAFSTAVPLLGSTTLLEESIIE